MPPDPTLLHNPKGGLYRVETGLFWYSYFNTKIVKMKMIKNKLLVEFSTFGLKWWRQERSRLWAEECRSHISVWIDVVVGKDANGLAGAAADNPRPHF